MPLESGTRLGPYQVAELLGHGGMGEVYRARDTRLQRDVAIKVLPDHFAADPERLARFEREAQLLASLNHLHIAQIYGLERAAGTSAIVMELVEGDTLASRIAARRETGPTPSGSGLALDQVLAIATQIADALEAAHERGVIHRDLKPSNIKITPDGVVKVLDFGLAKMLAPVTSLSPGRGEGATHSPTLSMAATAQGVILGTAAYMSPEQAKGRMVDKRTDVWAFGCVLYEMLAGRRAFDGDDVSEVLASVLAREPDLAALPDPVPGRVRQALRACLQKDLKRRARDIGDVRMAMEGAFESPAPASAAASGLPHPPARRGVMVPVALALLAGAVAAGVATWALAPALEPRVARFVVGTPATTPLSFSAAARDIAISPDGTKVVYTGAGPSGFGLYVRPVDRLESMLLASGATSPVISADGAWVLFFGADQTWKKVSMLGGPAVTLWSSRSAPRGASWGPDDAIILSHSAVPGLFSGRASGVGEPEPLTVPDAQFHYWPDILPEGRGVLFTISAGAATGSRNDQIAVLDSRTHSQKVLVQGGSHARYAATGHIVYAVDGTLRAVPFDLDRLEVTGDPVPVLEGVMTKPSGAANFDLSANGTLVYVAAGGTGLERRTLVWVDRTGREEAIPAPPRAYLYPRISPDGKKVALDVRDEQSDIWIWDLPRETLTRLTFDPGLDRTPVWSPDGTRLAFSSERGRSSQANVYSQASDGTGPVERLTESATLQFPTAFSPDGRQLLLWEIGNATGRDVAVVALDNDRTVTPLLQTSFFEENAEVSPDGRWLAYQSNESGQYEVYVRPFPDVEGGRWLVSNGGGTRPAWSRDGRELFYLVEPGRVMTVPIQPGRTFTYGNPQVVFDGPYVAGNAARTYDVSPDGKRFLMIKRAAGAGDEPQPALILVQNWLEELKRLVPTR
jgi:serine/threonine-protein kinase